MKAAPPSLAAEAGLGVPQRLGGSTAGLGLRAEAHDAAASILTRAAAPAVRNVARRLITIRKPTPRIKSTSSRADDGNLCPTREIVGDQTRGGITALQQMPPMIFRGMGKLRRREYGAK